MNEQILQIEHKLDKNPNWWEADQLAIYNARPKSELNSGLPRTNPASDRMEDLNQGPPDFKSSALNHEGCYFRNFKVFAVSLATSQVAYQAGTYLWFP